MTRVMHRRVTLMVKRWRYLGTHVVRGQVWPGSCTMRGQSSWGHTWPGKSVLWGHLTGGYIPQRVTSPWEGVPKGRRANPFIWGHTARGHVSPGSKRGQGHSTTEVTHSRGTQAPCTQVYPVPHLRVAVGEPPLPDVPPGPHPHGLPPALSNTTGPQFAVGNSQFRVPTTMGRDNPGDHRRMGHLWGHPEVENTGGGPLQAPHFPMDNARLGGGSCLGRCPCGHEGVKGPVQLCSADVRYADEAEQVL